MWCLVNVPANIATGLYKGKAVIKDEANETATIDINLFIQNKTQF